MSRPPVCCSLCCSCCSFSKDSDTTARYELRLSVSESFEKLQQLQHRLQQTGGLLITIFHNFSLGTDKDWMGWRERYAAFIKQAK
ncbi:MAG TPA: hypothetical protein VL092_03065 [Chitinophagaceae bacterium]|nr:hypothetical protein [Chitinophagaceae bacterium]